MFNPGLDALDRSNTDPNYWEHCRISYQAIFDAYTDVLTTLTVKRHRTEHRKFQHEISVLLNYIESRIEELNAN